MHGILHPAAQAPLAGKSRTTRAPGANTAHKNNKNTTVLNGRIDEVVMKEFVVDPTCKECKGTGKYVGLWLDVGPCRACQQRSQNSVHRCARAAQALTPNIVEREEQPEIRLNVGLQESWKKLFQRP